MALDSGKLNVINFFDSVQKPFEKTGTSSVGCEGYDILLLQVSGISGSTIIVEGCLNTFKADGSKKTEAEMSWSPMGVISGKTFKVVASNQIVEDGLYYIGVESCPLVRVNVTVNTAPLVITGVLR